MKYHSVFFFALLCHLTFATIGHATIGSLKEVIASANKGHTPKYIAQLNLRLSEKMTFFVNHRDITSPKQKLAFFLTMRSVMDVLIYEAEMLSRGEKGDGNWYRAFNSVTRSVDRLKLDLDYDYARVMADLAFRLTKAPLLTRADLYEYTAKQPEVVRFRVHQWIALNRFYENAFAILDFTFDWILDHLPKIVDGNPFDSADTWNHQKHRYRHLKPKAATFIAPWINALDHAMIYQQIPHAKMVQ